MYNQKIADRKFVAVIRSAHPEYTLQQIANLFDVSRERVRQILVHFELPTRRQYLSKYRCPVCQIPKQHANRCRRCTLAANSIFVSCNTCKTEIRVTPGAYSRHMKFPYSGKFYCNKRCFGSFIGKNYGLGRKKKL